MMVDSVEGRRRADYNEGTPATAHSNSDGIPPIYEQMREIDSNIDSLESWVRSYSDRLAPLLNNDGGLEQKTVPGPTVGSESPVTNGLRVVNIRLFGIRHALEDIFNKLEI